MRAVLPQHSSLQFAFRVLDVGLMGRSPHTKAFGRHDLEIARSALQKVDVAHLTDRLCPSLSGGERQRVHLARVLTQIWESDGKAARYLLLDEPTSALNLSISTRHWRLRATWPTNRVSVSWWCCTT